MRDIQIQQKMLITKTETEYNMKSIRFLLLTITTMFIIIASLMIVLGISVYTHYHNFSFFYESAKSGRFLTPSIMCVLLGIAILIVTTIGFYGSLKKSTCMVNLYAVILTVVLIFKLVVVILAFTLDTSSIVKYIDIPVWDYIYDKEIQQEVDTLQRSLNCCGSSSFLDYVHVPFGPNHSTVYTFDENYARVVVPESCCISSDGSRCTRMRPVGCKDALANLLVQNASVLGVLGVSVMFIQLLGIVFAVLLARCIRKMKSEKALMSWKIKEQMILARMADDQKSQDGTVYIDRPDSSVA